jgi:hypothetical protein
MRGILRRLAACGLRLAVFGFRIEQPKDDDDRPDKQTNFMWRAKKKLNRELI